jgi:polar amino acid transport system substrate-binding protein
MSARLPRWIAPMVAFAFAWASVQAQGIKAVTEDTSYTYLQDGKVAGPATQVVEATLKGAGLNDYRLGLYPWARAYDMAMGEPNVLIYLIARTPEREDLFKWVGEFMRIDYHFYRLQARQDVTLRDLQDAKRYKLGVVRNDVRHQFLQAQGFTKMVVSANARESFRKLLNQQVELVPLAERDALLLCEDAGIDAAGLQKVLTLDAMSTGIYMAYSKSTPDATVARTRAAFEKLKAEGTVNRLMMPGQR